tara:strand:- start:14 stop:328 length:315 start_codon:yes stop_codon:yes gene_type:complete
MLLDDKYYQLERLLKEYPINSDEYKRITFLMFGYTDDEIDEMMYKTNYCEVINDEPVEEINGYKDICSIPIMKDNYFIGDFNCRYYRPKIMTDNYINLNNKGGE